MPTGLVYRTVFRILGGGNLFCNLHYTTGLPVRPNSCLWVSEFYSAKVYYVALVDEALLNNVSWRLQELESYVTASYICLEFWRFSCWNATQCANADNHLCYDRQVHEVTYLFYMHQQFLFLIPVFSDFQLHFF
jgi:hypothetical protein